MLQLSKTGLYRITSQMSRAVLDYMGCNAVEIFLYYLCYQYLGSLGKIGLIHSGIKSSGL